MTVQLSREREGEEKRMRGPCTPLWTFIYLVAGGVTKPSYHAMCTVIFILPNHNGGTLGRFVQVLFPLCLRKGPHPSGRCNF